ncbi:sigma-70 family RNA polymerase sigma factor [Nocardioides sp. Kera G14]|uniref:sigma-70 family RNA polymerase sigma factor n=1 Tax=Nocardioides sp. Kera G14 TaxID=2884264 RepID=UPI001D0F9EB2|nr:sigma-70 family RNA polymerase sigma factor [Nocardioides sp. Kera G14]UDY24940.1 sigma-70 family RNA polymerase sigma factor [Nocardioides sp. Kera G14]
MLTSVSTSNSSKSTSTTNDDVTHDLLLKAAATDGAERLEILNEVVRIHLPLARRLSRRYSHRGEAPEDLEQVAYLALTKAAHGFDPEVGSNFLAFAIPTVLGELKRHFRGVAWTVRPPRRLQELQAEIFPAHDELTQLLGRTPTPAEIAGHIGSTEDEVRQALDCGGCYAPVSLDDGGSEPDHPTPADTLADDDDGFRQAETVALLAAACRELKPRDRRILALRFYRGCSQQEIADDLGVTQVQVCRLLQRIMATLRTALGDDVSVLADAA